MIQLFTFREGFRSLTLALLFGLTSCLSGRTRVPNSPFSCFLLLETYKPSIRQTQGSCLLQTPNSSLLTF